MKKRDKYVTAKCPKCGRFMQKVGDVWKCPNKRCGYQKTGDKTILG